MIESKINFASLDPSRDNQRWEARIANIARRAAEKRRKQLTVMGQLLAWSRPMLAIAASVAFVGWLGLQTFGESEPVASGTVDPALTLATWAVADQVPSTETVISMLGGSSAEP
jgi:hypothetical protein